MPATSSPFDRELHALADDQRRADTARARLRRADRRVVDGLSGNFLGSLVELAETGAPVTVLTRTELTIRGTIADIGNDVIVIRTAKSGTEVLLRTSAVEGLLETGVGHDRRVVEQPGSPTFVELLDRYSETHERVAVTTSSGAKSMGYILRVGEDQSILQLDGSSTAMTIPTSVIDHVMVSR